MVRRCWTQTVGHCLREMISTPLTPIVPPQVLTVTVSSWSRVTSAALYTLYLAIYVISQPFLLCCYSLCPSILPVSLPFMSFHLYLICTQCIVLALKSHILNVSSSLLSTLFLWSSLYYLSDSNIFSDTVLYSSH